MLDCLMTAAEKELQEEVRRFVKQDVDKQLLRDMDADRVRYPRSILRRPRRGGCLACASRKNTVARHALGFPRSWRWMK